MPKQVSTRTQKRKSAAKQPVRSGVNRHRTPFRRVSKQRIGRVVDRIVQAMSPECIVLFGSYAYGKPNRDSDVDMLVIMESSERPLLRITHVLDVLHGVKDFPMDILVRTPEEIRQRIEMGDFFIREIMEQGRILYERKPV